MNNQLIGLEIEIGTTVKAFNSNEWQKTGDIGDNSQFYVEAEIVGLRWHKSFYGGNPDYVADVRWKHSGELSRGHFVSGLKPLSK